MDRDGFIKFKYDGNNGVGQLEAEELIIQLTNSIRNYTGEEGTERCQFGQGGFTVNAPGGRCTHVATWKSVNGFAFYWCQLHRHNGNVRLEAPQRKSEHVEKNTDLELIKLLYGMLEKAHAKLAEPCNVFFSQHGKPIAFDICMGEAYQESAMCEEMCKVLSVAAPVVKGTK